MIIVSCLLAWGEAWFLDCRVIPQEKNAQRFYRLLMVGIAKNMLHFQNAKIIIILYFTH